MNELIQDLSMQYGIPIEKTRQLVSSVVDFVEKDIPVTCKEEIEMELGSTIKESVLRESGLFPYP